MNLQDLAADLRQYYPAIHTAVDRAALITDCQRFMVFRRCIRRYLNSGNINHRLALNQLITLINIFGAVAVTNKLQEFLTVDELFVAGAFTNFLGLTKVNSCFQIEDMLNDFQKRIA